jgi:hypothetical protein
MTRMAQLTQLGRQQATGSGSGSGPGSGSGGAGPATAPLRLVIAAVAVGVLAIGAGVALVTQGHAHHAAVARSRPDRPATAASAPASEPHKLQLVAGSRLVNGMYTYYPHSRAGAVSAAVEFVTELGSTLEPDRAATVARLTADPSDRNAPQDAAQDAISTRRQLGLPPAGATPPGAAVFLVPVMYQLRGVTADQLTVLLLFDYTETVPSGIREHLGVTAARLNWTPAGWRLLPPAGPDPSGLLATPGTAAATAKGWEAMTNAM